MGAVVQIRPLDPLPHERAFDDALWLCMMAGFATAVLVGALVNATMDAWSVSDR